MGVDAIDQTICPSVLGMTKCSIAFGRWPHAIEHLVIPSTLFVDYMWFLLHVFQYYYLNIKILKFYENLEFFEIWNFWIFWSFHIFWKFWTLNFFLFFFTDYWTDLWTFFSLDNNFKTSKISKFLKFQNISKFLKFSKNFNKRKFTIR
jgi:hypothetical protein